MKKVIIFVMGLVIIVLAVTVFLIDKVKEESQRIDAEAVTLKENLIVEFGEKVKVSDFLENLNGTLIEDVPINTEKLGDVQVSFAFKNIKNKKRTFEFSIKVVDREPPKILVGNSYTVKVGYDKNLTDVLLSGDNADDNPKREIVGEYDLNAIGNYDLTYIVTDSSGNKIEQKFSLSVKEQKEEVKPKTKVLPISDIIENYKTENTKIGIDVSKWNREINWQEVKESGIEFAIIRIGYQTEYDGDYVLDPYFIANIEGAKAVGLPVGIYFYSYAKNVNQAIEQAEWIKENLKDYKIDLPIAFDWESWNSFNTTGMSFYCINQVANVFLDTLQKAGYDGMLYSSKTYLEDIWYPTKHKTWLAQYNTKTTYEGDYFIWQMCENGAVKGIEDKVDVNIMYLEN